MKEAVQTGMLGALPPPSPLGGYSSEKKKKHERNSDSDSEREEREGAGQRENGEREVLAGLYSYGFAHKFA